MADPPENSLVTLDVDQPVMARAFTVAPLVLIGTRDPDGGYDLAPKHMATPLGWENYFGFVCTPRHRTYHNARREGAFTVSYPRPRQIVLASLAAGPRCDDGSKPSLESLATFPAKEVDGVFIEEAFFFLECSLHQVIDGFGENSLIAGRIVAAHVDPAALRMHDRDDSDVVHHTPLLAYLDPGRFARIDKSFSFPYMADYQK